MATGKVFIKFIEKHPILFILFVPLSFLTPILGALMGAITGWFVGLFFGDTILGFLAQIGIQDVEMWQFGCFLGFIGGFFKPRFDPS
mgnify:CR=1 FL=1|jgi:hypothetical protein